MNFIALNYPNSEEGKQAQDIYSNVLTRLASKEFVDEESSKSFKLVYSFNSSESEVADLLFEKLQKAITFFNYTNMKVSVDYYSPETILVLVHGLNTKLGARGFAEVLKEHKEYKIKRPYFEISSENYKIVQIHKNLTDYLNKDTIELKESNPQK